MSGWREGTLGEIFRFKAGTGFPKEIQGTKSGELPFAKVSDMNSSGNEIYLSSAENYISRAQAKSLKAYIHKRGSVAFAKIGIALTTNRRRQLNQDIVLDNNMMSAEPFGDTINPKFGYYLLLTLDFNEISAGSALPYLTVGSLKDMKVSLPPASEQREIAAILGALDDKIEVNRKASATLEEMARALYRSWFVDFDPVWARLEGRQPAHMDAATAALFPDSFGDDGLPVGWRKEAIGSHVQVERGLSYKGSNLCEKDAGIPLHNLNSVFEGGGYKHAGIKYYNGEFKDRHLIHPGDLIVTNTEQGFDLLLMGHGALVPQSFGPVGIFSQHIYKVTPLAASPLTREWVYFMLSVSPSGVEVRSYSNGTTVNMLPLDALDIPKVIVPSHQVSKAFSSLAMPLLTRKDTLTDESRTLATLRDTLLPRLMSGELRVGEARELVEEVA